MGYSKKKVLVILTGWTIAGKVATNDVWTNVIIGSKDFSFILKHAVKFIKERWNIEVESSIIELFNVDSSNINPDNWTTLIEKIQEEYDNFDAFIVLHGTNTMGYTSAALSFALENINKPVILTGSQVPLGSLWSDAVTNLVNALRIAVREYTEIKWVMVIFGTKIIQGTRVKKGTDFDYDSFWSFHIGTLWRIWRYIKIDHDNMQKYTNYLSKKYPLAIHAKVLKVKKNFSIDHITSLTEIPDMQVDIFQSLVENNGIKAFILRAFGAGDPSAHLFPAFEYLKEKQIPIIVTTQTHNGHSNFQVNETGQYLREHELAIPAYDMSLESMTVKMWWLLSQWLSYEQIKMKMLEDLHGEINVENEMI